jgi:hypothetical protein
MRLEEIALNIRTSDPVTKSMRCYIEYEKYFEINNIFPKHILEIGVHKGESTKILSRRFPDSKIIALDISDQEIDFSEFPNIKYINCDQTDRKLLKNIILTEFPDGLDLILDDGSHIGVMSEVTFYVTYPHLKSGGVYIIEDWGTGYLKNWIDGGEYQEYKSTLNERQIPKRIPSHDYGMVGFVKSLVDLSHEQAMRNNYIGKSSGITQIRKLEFTEGICFIQKH